MTIRSCLFFTMFVSTALVSLACPLAIAQTQIVSHTDRGWYTSTGIHSTTNLNFIAGDHRGPGCGPCSNDFRNFFVFDLTNIDQRIASAALVLLLPADTTIPIYGSADPGENYELHDVIGPISLLMNGTNAIGAYYDLGNGVVYGSRTITAADTGNVVEITLNSSAITAMNAATGLFAIGGSITTLDNVANHEYVFAATHNVATSELRLTLAPEPSTLALVAIGCAAIGYRRRLV